MNDRLRFPDLPNLPAAIASGYGLVVTAIANAAVPGGIPNSEWLTGIMAAGFLWFVRRWMIERKRLEQEVLRTMRKQNEQRLEFERTVTHFMLLVAGRLGLENSSDPALLVADVLRQRAGLEKDEDEEDKEEDG